MPLTFLSPRKTSSASHSNNNVPAITLQEPPTSEPSSNSNLNASANANRPMSSAFVSKSRKVRFDLSLRIIDLNNVPLVSGTSFIKWHLPSSTAAEHRGRTNKCVIRDHRVAYEYEKRLPVRLTVGKDGMLQECPVEFEILQEYSASGRGERIELGNVRLNLAEYVDVGGDPTSPGPPREDRDEEGGIVRRYLMQDSKINSTLKLGIHMRYVEGTREYTAPPLRTAPVFGGIAGIISSSEPVAPSSNAAGGPGGAGNPDDAGAQEPLPNLSTRSKEIGEMQDMYRRTLAAFWASQPGELKADECIEDIFAGGDGWGSKIHRDVIAGGGGGGGKGEANAHHHQHATSSLEGAQERSSRQYFRNHHHHNNHQARERADSNTTTGPGSGASTPRAGEGPRERDRDRDLEGVDVTARGEGRVHAQGKGMLGMGRRQRHTKNFGQRGQGGFRRGFGEVDEWEVREDLRSWQVGEAAMG